MPLIILKLNQSYWPNLFTWYFLVFIVNKHFLNEVGGSGLNQGDLKKIGGIKVTRKNERIIYCCDHFLPWFLYWDYTGLSPTRSYFSGLCRYPWYDANRRQISESYLKCKHLLIKFMTAQKRWRKTHITNIILQH